VQELAKRFEEHAKGMLTPSTLFEEFGFNYTGPIDGHNLEVLVDTLNNVKRLDGPQFLHVVTRKGQGYAYAEEDPITYHGPGKFDPDVGIVRAKPAKDARPKPSYTQVFGDWLCDMARRTIALIGITPAMREGSGLVKFSQEFPDRYFDVGIAEQHAVTFAAGLAVAGMKPVVAIYSTFLQRAYDQLIHDVALQNLPVTFALDRGGLVGADGPDAPRRVRPLVPALHPQHDRDGPRRRERVPADALHGILHRRAQRPCAIPRGTGPGAGDRAQMTALPVGKGEIRREGKRVAILAFGSMVKPALEAGDGAERRPSPTCVS
jgi:1-deoxy-D-xylulose-5-phosphate synthase